MIRNEDEKFALANVKKLTGLKGRWDVIHETTNHCFRCCTQ
ncbi:MAG: hypothetical protein WDM71_10660 [Ferruginibacter sp.]